MAVDALKITFNTAFPITGLSANHKTSLVNQMYCQKNIIQIIHEITLNKTWEVAICLFIRLPPKDQIIAVKVVHIFDPIAIAIDAGNEIIPASRAASAMIHKAPLDWITKVTIIHNIPNQKRLMSAYWVRSKVALIASTLSFMKSNPKKRSQNHTSSFAQFSCFSLKLKINASHQIAIIGKAIADILKLPNPITAASNGSIGDQIFAQKINQIAFFNASTPAPAKARVSNDNKLLLWRILVVQNHVKIDFHQVSVYFWRISFSLFHPKNLIACSKMFIQKMRTPIHASKSQILNSIKDI